MKYRRYWFQWWLPRKPRGFFAGLTKEQQARALAYRGPDSFGDPNAPKRLISKETESKLLAVHIAVASNLGGLR